MIKDDGEVCIADPAFNMLMRRLTYDPYVPTPATWQYKPWEELQNGTTSREADVYSWASVVYEVSEFRSTRCNVDNSHCADILRQEAIP